MSNDRDGASRKRPEQDDDTSAGKNSRSGEGSQSALDALKKTRVPPAPAPADPAKK